MSVNGKFEEEAGRIVALCKSLLGVSGGCISVPRADHRGDEVVIASAGRSPCADRPLPAAIRRLMEEARGSSTPLYWNADKDKKSRRRPSEGVIQFDSVMFAPMTLHDNASGLLCLFDKPGGFDAGDARIAAAFAEIASIILDHARMLESLRQSEDRFRSIVQKAADAVITVDEGGRISGFNDSAEAMFGYSAVEVGGKSIRLIVPRRLYDKHRKDFRRAVETGNARLAGKTVEVTGLKRDGSEFPVELSLAVSRTAGRTLFTGILRDITDRKSAELALEETRAELERIVRERTASLTATKEQLKREMKERERYEHALQESEEKYRIVAERTYDWEWWLGPDGRFIYMSPACERITGRDPDDFLSDPGLISKVIHADDRAAFAEHRRKVDETLLGGEVEFRIVRPDGTHRWVAHLCQPVFDRTGEFVGHRGSNRDVTARREAEIALRQSEERLRFLSSRLLAVQESERRRVAREVHDGINQTLAAVKFALESKLDQMGKVGAPPGISLENIISLVQQGIEEARRIQMDLRPAILDDLGILATLSWFSREFQNVYRDIQVVREIGVAEQDVPAVLKIVIFRIVQEALNNVARHAKARFVRISLHSPGGGIELVIEDDGRGFDLARIERGFGLVSMRERAEFSGGSFEVQSTPGKGTTLRAHWPV